MKFFIRRASDSSRKTPPTEGAVLEEDGTWSRWTIEIASLDDLMALVMKEGELVLGQDDIWIYDDYME